MKDDLSLLPALSRRSFLALASAAVGVWIRPALAAGVARGERGHAGASPPPRDPDHALVLRVPRMIGNGAKVPIVIEAAHPMTPGHHVTQVRVHRDGDPISSKGTFFLSPANGRVFLAFQARMHEGASPVTATAECNLHGTFSASSPVEIPRGAGGCMGGGPPAFGRTPGEDVRGPVIRIAELVERGVIRRGEVIHLQVKMRHPNRTGLVLRDDEIVQEEEPIHLDEVEVFYGGEPVCRFATTSALSDDPLITFALLARRSAKLQVVVTNCRGQRFEGAHDLVVA